MTGRTADGRIETVRVVPEGSPVANYAFDVTPARLVTGLITERGVLQSFDSALALQPRHLTALLGKAMVSERLRHFDAALRALDAIFAINPRAPVALVLRGQIKLILGKFDEAEADFDAALAIDPTQESAWAGKASHGLLANRIAQSIHACQKVLEKNPASAIATCILGSCHAAQGDVATALPAF
jgi:predicted Zn-dependent protease